MPINELRVSGSKLEPPSRPSQDWSKQRPSFGKSIQTNVNVELGKTAHLTCTVFDLGDKTVSSLPPSPLSPLPLNSLFLLQNAETFSSGGNNGRCSLFHHLRPFLRSLVAVVAFRELCLLVLARGKQKIARFLKKASDDSAHGRRVITRN